MVEGNVLEVCLAFFFLINSHALLVQKYPQYLEDLALHIEHPQLTELTC